MPALELLAEPKIQASLKKLVAEHRKIKDEPLELGVSYEPPKAGKHIHLFEIASNFGAESVDPDKKMFQVSYGSTIGFPLEANQELRLLLTNPTEWKKAIQENWPAVRALRGARARGKAQVLFATAEGKRLWERL